MRTRDLLLASLRSRLHEDAWRWLERAAADAPTCGVDEILTLYTSASQRLGMEPLGPETGSQPGPSFKGWSLEDAGRAVILLSRVEQSHDDQDWDAVSACYEQGDAREQQSWLKAVGVLPAPQRFLPLVIDACRSSIQPIFEAVACENPYPARFFPERNFNQLILKALFNGVALSRVVGLSGRLNPELARMATDYAAERRAAGRPIPTDISLAVGESGTVQEQSR